MMAQKCQRRLCASTTLYRDCCAIVEDKEAFLAPAQSDKDTKRSSLPQGLTQTAILRKISTPLRQRTMGLSSRQNPPTSQP